MGLNRYFTITAETRNHDGIYNPELAEKAFDAINDRYGGWRGALDDYNAMTMDGANWYDVDDQMRAVSKKFPELIFCVECLGSTLDDTWIEYYCDGRSSGGCAELPEPDYAYLLTGKHESRVPIILSDDEYRLVEKALICLADCRNDEMKWAADDPDLLKADRDCIDAIDALHEKIFNT